MEWQHRDAWKYTDSKTFTVEVTRHQLDYPPSGCYDSDGGQRWCVYAYIYRNHPHFANFDETDRMWQSATASMPLHGGASYFKRHLKIKDGQPHVESIQVGCDYNHDGDWIYSQQITKDDAYGVFADAMELVEWLSRPAYTPEESLQHLP